MTDVSDPHEGLPSLPAHGWRGRFDERFLGESDPYRYGERAIEALRHERVAATANALARERILEIGCALGQITRRLHAAAGTCAIDISPTAVKRARTHQPMEAGLPEATFAAASVLTLPFRCDSFDMVIASDGLMGWGLTAEERAIAILEIAAVLAPGGHALFTEHLRPAQFDAFVASIGSHMEVASVAYFSDRLSYQLEAALKSVRAWRPARAILRSRALARGLMVIGRSAGRMGSRHILVIARRRATTEAVRQSPLITPTAA